MKKNELLNIIEAEIDNYFWNISTPQTLTDDLISSIHTEILDIIDRSINNEN
jgi:hypothetical protein